MKTFYKTIIPGLAGLLTIVCHPANAQYGRHYEHRYYPRAERIAYFRRPSVVIRYGGIPYHYYDGLFYRPYGSYFGLVVPPIGIRVNVLPYGYRPIRIGGGMYFYLNGIFYRQYDGYYEVVNAPVGAEVPELPRGAQAVVIDGKKLYEYDGTYYKETIKSNDEIWYTVVGKDGVVDTDGNSGNGSNNSNGNSNDSYKHYSSPEVGSTVSILPDDCKTVTINNQKYYVAPDGTYYEEVHENNEVYYKVAGKSSVE